MFLLFIKENDIPKWLLWWRFKNMGDDDEHKSSSDEGRKEVDIYPLSCYYFGSKEAIVFKDETVPDRITRMKSKYFFFPHIFIYMFIWFAFYFYFFVGSQLCCLWIEDICRSCSSGWFFFSTLFLGYCFY